MKPVAEYVPIYKPGTKELLCRYDPMRDLIEIVERRIRYVIDLAAERQRAEEGRQEHQS